MFCPQCGTNNADNAVTCVQCGRPFQGAPPAPPVGVVLPPGYQPPGSVPNYLVPAILVTIFCCLPTGIAAIVYAAQVNSQLAAGNVAGAMQSSKNAKMWCWISAGASLLVLGAYIMLILFGVLSSMHR